MKTLLLARWVAPMDQPPISGGGVVLAAGKIVAVGPAGVLRSQYPDAQCQDWGDGLILPGLVNAHTHLELSDRHSGNAPSGGFAVWLIQIIQQRMAAGASLPQATAAAVKRGVEQCLRFGVTTVGDISRHCQITRATLSAGPLRTVSYGEVQAMGQLRHRLDERLHAAMDDSSASPWLRIGLTPHAPYTVEPDAYRRCLELARTHHLPLATHLAESPDEDPFLSDHTGPFRDLWSFLGQWDDAVPRFSGGPIRLAAHLGLLDYPTLLAHVNYCDDQELSLLAGRPASVIFCPRTHAYFGHPPHPWRRMLAAGVNIAIGTDSCASSPDLNLVDELRLLHRTHPDVPADQLWRLATLAAAKALGMEKEVGTLSPGKHADLTLFPASGGGEALTDILDNSQAAPLAVYIAGERVSR